MAFKLSSHKKNGQRINSVLIEGNEATISNSESADIQLNIPEGTSISITEKNGSLSIRSQGISTTVKGKEISDESTSIGSGAQFQCMEQDFYVTTIISGEPTPRKKGYLSGLALTLIWTLLAIQLIVPVWLPYKITGHKVKGRNVLIENCSKGLDDLRKTFSKRKGDLGNASQINRDIITRLSEEVEQMAWVFRNAGEFMSKSELEKLELDIEAYFKILNNVKKTDAVTIEALKTENAVRKILKTEQ
ncbi:MAG: hypothetical protein NE328_01605 [Lentisphaeraceae bacterium]|nr:hypothetical protein [Lentisphaeraceae bacterium]